MTNLADLERYLTSQGYKLTRNRRIILQGLLNKAGWSNAREIHAYVLAHNNKVNFSTIYRNLDALTSIGLLCRVERPDAVNYYTLNHASGHHHHLICKSCHKICELEFCPLSLIDPEALHNFTEVECKFDLYGFCRECQEKNK
ncbi:MAG: Fur family transcriptional regulator [Syntrophomonadaceae bacterium]